MREYLQFVKETFQEYGLFLKHQLKDLYQYFFDLFHTHDFKLQKFEQPTNLEGCIRTEYRYRCSCGKTDKYIPWSRY